MPQQAKSVGRSGEAPNDEITFSYPDLEGMEPLVITNSRKVAVQLIQGGYTACLIPQMFGCDTGLYGLHPCKDAGVKTLEEADGWLLKEEDKIMASFRLSYTRPGKPVQNQKSSQTP